MSYRTVEAGRGVQWLSSAVALTMKNPGVFLVIALIFAVMQAVPVVMLVIGPALFGGFIYAMREQDQGRTAEVGQLFIAFQIPGKIGPMLVLCIPGIIATAVIVVMLFVFLGSAIMGIALGGTQDQGAGLLAGLGVGAILFVLIAVCVAFAAYALLFFAIPRVMFDGVDPVAAMKESIAASLANFASLLVFSIVFCLGALVALVVLFFIPILGLIVWGLGLSVLGAASTYVAYKDIFEPGTMTA
jgi:hypothetical protein